MVSCQVKPTITACVRNSGSAHAERAATNGYAGVEAAETGESDARERGRECCARDGTVGVAQYVSYYSTGHRGEESMRGRHESCCNNWISWGQ